MSVLYPVAANAEAVVVGSAIVNQIGRHGKAPGLVPHIVGYLEPLIQAVKGKPASSNEDAHTEAVCGPASTRTPRT